MKFKGKVLVNYQCDTLVYVIWKYVDQGIKISKNIIFFLGAKGHELGLGLVRRMKTEGLGKVSDKL